MRILVIEDEKKTAAFLAEGLREAGFAVDVAIDGETGLKQARATKFDLLIVDIMLPHKDGWDVVAELRRDGVPHAHFVSYRPRQRPRSRERTRAWCRRLSGQTVSHFQNYSPVSVRCCGALPSSSPEHLRIEDLELDVERHKATRSGIPLNLTPKEFLLLAHLVRSTGAVVSRDEIAEHVWTSGHDRHERRRCGCPPVALESGRPVQDEADPHDSRRRLRSQRTLNGQ